ncbi:iron complex outermembrane recepter protein [Pustulibacterium marinum]|uniref:Iron complex outermembrane recepter protein n=1 Tax=Pustulibacterium marinum TaxID=1224947 RepID=A0A1I7FN51_9FLAO|nr:TonB-dependent receptor plug domain-containing protein [Pustulibacterium marinum]SFU37568.1 iron complex outermembrane recepter protein [Pustulibacterium marinum]
MRYLYLIIGIVFQCATVYAQESVQITGTLIDATNQSPIENGTVIYKNDYAVSNVAGNFTLTVEATAKLTLHVSHMSYETQHVALSNQELQKPIRIVLLPKNTALSAVEVTAQSTTMNTETPMMSTAITKTYLEENRENSLMQTLSKIPGVSTINIGSGQSKPVIRGLGFNRVSVVENGIKHEAQQWGADHGLEIDQYGIEHINVIKGPASLLYGSDAIAGVVAITPPNVPLPHSFKGNINLLGESNNSLLGISTGITARKENWFYRARITVRDYADYKVPTDRVQRETLL